MTAVELKDLDLAYAPPYSSAKDPVNMAGFMIDNIANGTLKQWHLADLESLPMDGSVTLLDTRTVGEYRLGHIDGFLNIPVDELRERLNELDRSKPIYVICQSGLRSYIASRILRETVSLPTISQVVSASTILLSMTVRLWNLRFACGMDK